jgi:hypothetical protein
MDSLPLTAGLGSGASGRPIATAFRANFFLPLDQWHLNKWPLDVKEEIFLVRFRGLRM